MSNWPLLRVMILKEIQTTFRERSQIRGIVVALIMVFVVGSTFYRTGDRPHFPARQIIVNGQVIKESGVNPPPAPQWIIIAAAAIVAFFFSFSYLISAVLASFVGEKEAKTLEILLASPLSEGKLYAIKCVSSLLPSAGIGFFFAVVAAVLAVIVAPAEIGGLTAGRLFSSLILSLPFLILLQLWFVGLGAAISVKAETMRGAAQIFGIVFMVMFFGVGYGTPFLLVLFPALRPPLMRVAVMWGSLNFAAQYGAGLLLAGVPAVVFMGIGRACFRRDRMLT